MYIPQSYEMWVVVYDEESVIAFPVVAWLVGRMDGEEAMIPIGPGLMRLRGNQRAELFRTTEEADARKDSLEQGRRQSNV